jgi:hypothetical protein
VNLRVTTRATTTPPILIHVHFSAHAAQNSAAIAKPPFDPAASFAINPTSFPPPPPPANNNTGIRAVAATTGPQKRNSTPTSSATLKNVAVSQLPARVAESALRQQLANLLLASRSHCKLIDISFEHAGEATKALLLLQK